MFWIFSNIFKNIEVDVLSKTSAENRSVKKIPRKIPIRIAALKHRIVIRKLNIAHPHTLLGQLLTFANTV